MGSTHQVLTIRKTNVISLVPNENSLIKVGLDSESKYVDQPIDFSGGYRFCLWDNKAIHMGNKYEKWFEEHIPKVNNNLRLNIKSNRVNSIPNKYIYKVKKKIVKLFYIKKLTH